MTAPSWVKRRAGQLLRYASTAGVAAIVDLGGFGILERAGLALVLSAVLSFWLATIVNYLLTARYVFGHAASLWGYGRFLSAAAFGFSVNVGVTALAAFGLAFAPLIAKATGIAVAFLVNFILNVVFVFDEGKTD